MVEFESMRMSKETVRLNQLLKVRALGIEPFWFYGRR